MAFERFRVNLGEEGGEGPSYESLPPSQEAEAAAPARPEGSLSDSGPEFVNQAQVMPADAIAKIRALSSAEEKIKQIDEEIQSEWGKARVHDEEGNAVMQATLDDLEKRKSAAEAERDVAQSEIDQVMGR